MLQVFYLVIAKVDLDLAYTCMLQAYVSSVFNFIRMFASVSSRCCICLQWFSNVFLGVFVSVLNVCFKCFICLLLYVAVVIFGCFKSRSMIFKYFSCVSVNVSDAYFKCFICIICMSICFSSRSGVAHMVHVGSARRRRPTAGALPHDPDALCARLLPLRSSI
jgi:hypothetical protein